MITKLPFWRSKKHWSKRRLLSVQCVWNARDEVKFDTPLSRVSECARDSVSTSDVVMCRLLSGCVSVCLCAVPQ